MSEKVEGELEILIATSNNSNSNQNNPIIEIPEEYRECIGKYLFTRCNNPNHLGNNNDRYKRYKLK